MSGSNVSRGSSHISVWSTIHYGVHAAAHERQSRIQPLKILAAVVHPPEGYAREGLYEYTTSTPLNRFVDAVSPESDRSRKFHELVKLIVAGKASSRQWQEARDWLVLWRDNDRNLQPLLGASSLTAELIPVSHTLSQVAALGLQALDDLQSHRVLDLDSLKKTKQKLEDDAKPQAELVNMVAPSVELLVQACSAP